MADGNGTENRQLDGLNKSATEKPGKSTAGTGTAEKSRNNSSEQKGTGTGTGTAGTAGTGTGTAEEKKLSELATLSVEQSEKPKKKRTRKKVTKNDSTFNAEQITALLLTASAILTQNEETAVFAITEVEARQLAEPIANLIAKNDSLQQLSEHADGVALLSAAFMIFAPKLFIFLQHRKQKKQLKKQGLQLIKEKEVKSNDKTGTIKNDSRGTNGATTANSSTNANNVMSSIPSIM